MKIKTKILFKYENQGNEVFWKIKRYILEKLLLNLNLYNLKNNKQVVFFAFDYVSTSISLDGVYEKDELNIFIEWLKNFKQNGIFEGTVLDIGANIGNHSLFFSDYFRDICSYEPNPIAFEVLKINSKLVTNIQCYNFGLSSFNKESSFIINENNIGGSKIDNNFSGSGIDITLRKLDDINSKSFNKINLIKIDVEGHELDVLIGAIKTIKQHNPIIIFEQHESDFNNESNKVIDLIKSYGYKNFACIEKHPSPPSNIPESIKLIYSLIYRLLFGSKKEIILKPYFEKKFYPFIIAIPDWMQLK